MFGKEIKMNKDDLKVISNLSLIAAIALSFLFGLDEAIIIIGAMIFLVLSIALFSLHSFWDYQKSNRFYIIMVVYTVFTPYISFLAKIHYSNLGMILSITGSTFILFLCIKCEIRREGG